MKKLKDFCDIKTNMQDADFWLVSSSSSDKVGMPIRIFDKDYIGVKVTATDVLDKDYLFYLMMFFYSIGTFKKWSRGTIGLQHIRVKDVEQITIGG